MREWDEAVKEDDEVKEFLISFDLVPPLQPRDAFVGGRTGAISLLEEAGEDEKILYVDVTSLYPWVNKNGVYPV